MKILRTTAFNALMTVAAKISQMTNLPTVALSQSMARDSLSSTCIGISVVVLSGARVARLAPSPRGTVRDCK